jgi:hypothetical protein
MSNHIDMTPTWALSVKVYLEVLANPNADESCKADARGEIERLARIVDKVVADKSNSKPWWKK